MTVRRFALLAAIVVACGLLAGIMLYAGWQRLGYTPRIPLRVWPWLPIPWLGYVALRGLVGLVAGDRRR